MGFHNKVFNSTSVGLQTMNLLIQKISHDLYIMGKADFFSSDK